MRSMALVASGRGPVESVISRPVSLSPASVPGVLGSRPTRRAGHLSGGGRPQVWRAAAPQAGAGHARGVAGTGETGWSEFTSRNDSTATQVVRLVMMWPGEFREGPAPPVLQRIRMEFTFGGWFGNVMSVQRLILTESPLASE